MSEYMTFQQDPAEEAEDMKSLLRGIDLQICLMRVVRSQIEACIKAENHAKDKVHELDSRYGKSGYMADVEIDENGEVATIRYDWVDP